MLGLFKRKSETVISSPFQGRILNIEEVNDPVFSKKMLGEGIGVIPENSVAVAPCQGEIIQIFPTKHAFGLITENGVEVLVHIGIDTVELKGSGFEALAKIGDKVKAGTPIIEVDWDVIDEHGKDRTTVVVITNSQEMDNIHCYFDSEDKVIVAKKKKLKIKKG